MKNINIAAKAAWLMLLPLVFLAGCLGSDEDYEAVQVQRDEYRARLQTVYQANDRLNQEISSLYASCEVLSTQLAMKMAMLVHREYVVNLVRLRVEAAPTRPDRPAATAAAPTRQPRAEGEGGRQQQPPRSQAGGSGTSGGTGTQGTAASPNDTAAAASPPVNQKPRGSIDWGN